MDWDLNFDSGDYSDTSVSDNSGSSYNWGLNFDSGNYSDTSVSDNSGSSYDWDLDFSYDDYSQDSSDWSWDNFYDTGMDWMNGFIGLYGNYQRAEAAGDIQNGSTFYPIPEQQSNPDAKTFDVSGIPPNQFGFNNQPPPAQKNNNLLFLGAGVALLSALL